MNQYEVSDYGIFDEANGAVKTLTSELDKAVSIIEQCKAILSDEGIFMGPIADECKSATDKCKGEIANLAVGFNRIGAYFNSVSSAYQKGDNDTLKQLLQVGSSSAAAGGASSASGSSGSGSIVTGNVNGVEYNMVDTKCSVDNFFDDIVQGKGLYQAYNIGAYSDKCLGFATTYAYELYNGTTDMTGSQCDNGLPWKFGFESYQTSDKEEYLTKLYDELNEGKPVVIQVVGSKRSNGVGRHYVTAVGYNSDVKSASDLKDTDILIIDSYDGNRKSLVEQGDNSGRYLLQGTDTSDYKVGGNKNYDYGYQMFVVPEQQK